MKNLCFIEKAFVHLFELIIDNTYISILGVQDFFKVYEFGTNSCVICKLIAKVWTIKLALSCNICNMQ